MATGRDYRLPSEAEWEYACRAGTTTPLYFGETITGEIANYDSSVVYQKEQKTKHRKETVSVGSFLPNQFGLCEMHGNVREWCLDQWHDSYEGAPIDGSAWIDKNTGTKVSRVTRGGSWSNDPWNCRSAYRFNFNPVNRFNNFGFRVVCAAPSTLAIPELADENLLGASRQESRPAPVM
jgi:formylglycine-generating enzyme required for sulfatase activity